MAIALEYHSSAAFLSTETPSPRAKSLPNSILKGIVEQVACLSSSNRSILCVPYPFAAFAKGRELRTSAVAQWRYAAEKPESSIESIHDPARKSVAIPMPSAPEVVSGAPWLCETWCRSSKPWVPSNQPQIALLIPNDIHDSPLFCLTGD
jgi:hypothetical protein